MNFQQNPSNESKLQPELTFLSMQVLLVTYRSLPFLHFLGGVAPVKIMNFEEYASIATGGRVRKFIIIQVNCT